MFTVTTGGSGKILQDDASVLDRQIFTRIISNHHTTSIYMHTTYIMFSPAGTVGIETESLCLNDVLSSGLMRRHNDHLETST